MVDVVAWAAGVLTTLGTWLLPVLRDLSEIDAQGRRIAGRGDDWAMLFAVLAVVASLGVLIAVLRSKSATWIAAGGVMTWVSLFAWRASASRVVGANLWVVGFLLFVLPMAIVAFVLVAGVARWRVSYNGGRRRWLQQTQ